MIGLLGKIADIVDTGGNVLSRWHSWIKASQRIPVDFPEKVLERHFEVGEHVQMMDESGCVSPRRASLSPLEDARTMRSNVIAFNPLTGEQWQGASKNVQSVKEDSVAIPFPPECNL